MKTGTKVFLGVVAGGVAGMVIANYLSGGVVKEALVNIGDKIKTVASSAAQTATSA
jgi:hypothetical protein